MAASTMASNSNDRTVLYGTLLLVCQVCFALTPSAAAFNITYIQEDLNGNCWQYIRYRGGLVYSHAGYGGYASNADCKLTITTEHRKRIHVRFETFDLTESINCYQDEVVVYDGKTFSSLLLSGTPYGLCGNGMPPQYTEMVSSGNIVTVRFITDGIVSDNQGFSLIYTTFVPDEELTGEDSDCFMCTDGSMCIDNSLVCDGLENCLDSSDEEYALCFDDPNDDSYSSFTWLTWMGTIFGVVVAFAVVLIVAIAVIVYCCCRSANRRSRNNQCQYNNNMNGAAHGPGYATQMHHNGRSGGYIAPPSSRYGPSQVTSGYASSEDGYFGNNSVTYHAGHHQTMVALPPNA
ncbi:uncharacterized protein LOC100377643 [Saccoglossus kowalevskii]|uniref:Uncharacterized protein LOC100377643 n=1 Tax=Saccoglossus kowalevskii TaxID=10224 RepID=A0ABM0GXI9_SACKO|nr:PREDICTED: uncharacterized protein LOC100377643 [Saccoglossus kowalevskii]